jgi:hypothetical protein
MWADGRFAPRGSDVVRQDVARYVCLATVAMMDSGFGRHTSLDDRVAKDRDLTGARTFMILRMPKLRTENLGMSSHAAGL